MGIDPGRWVGWSVLEARGRNIVGRVDLATGYVAAGVLDLEELGEAAVVLELQALALAHRVTRCGIERVIRVQERSAVTRAAMASQATQHVNAAWLGGTVADRLRNTLLPMCGACAKATTPRACSCSSIDVRTVQAEQVRAHYIAGVGPVEAKHRKAAGEARDMDGAVAAVVRERVAGWPAKLLGHGAAYMLPTKKSGDEPTMLRAAAYSHAHDAALVALYVATLGAP